MKRTAQEKSQRQRGFTLIELIVVVAIIALLMGLLVAALPGVKKKAQDNATRQLLTGISMACETYFETFDAYPGPFGPAITTSGANSTPSGTQNLFLGLAVSVYVNGSYYSASGGQPAVQGSAPQTPPVPFNSGTGWVGVPAAAGVLGNSFNVGDRSGPIDLRSSPPRTMKAFFSPDAKEVSVAVNGAWQSYGVLGATGGGLAFPTLVDRYPEAMPLLYYRRTPGVEGSASISTETTGRPVGDVSGMAGNSSTAYAPATPKPYYLKDNLGYTASTGLRSIRNTTYAQGNFTELDLAGYAANRKLTGNMPSTPVNARGNYILVSAGYDHIYGVNPKTKMNDDIYETVGP